MVKVAHVTRWWLLLLTWLAGGCIAQPKEQFCSATFVVNSGAIQYFAPETTTCAVFQLAGKSNFQMHNAGDFVGLIAPGEENFKGAAAQWNDATVEVVGEWVHEYPDFEINFHGKSVQAQAIGTPSVSLSFSGFIRGHVDFEAVEIR